MSTSTKRSNWQLFRSFSDAVAIAVTIAAAVTFVRGSITEEHALPYTLALTAAVVIGLASPLIVRLSRRAAHRLTVPRVFVSYSADTEQVARRVSDQLRQLMGAKVYEAEDHIEPGMPIRPAIDHALADADVVLAFFSKELDYAAKEEIDLALQRGVRIIPVRVSSDAPVPETLSNLLYLDWHAGEDVVVSKIVQALS